MKPFFVISCPIDTYSGYGARSRDLVKAIIELDKYEVKILPQRWGNTPWNFIGENKEEWGFLEPYLLPPHSNQLPKQPDIWAQITVPNEFQAVGKYNIGFTAGIETTVCDPSWIQGINRMDLNIVSSNHAKNVFLNSTFSEQQNGQVVGELKCNKPIEVLFEGGDLSKFFPSKEKSNFNLKDIKESFAYLYLGHWMQGDIGEDRKNTGLLVKTFLETFKDQRKSPCLIMKTSGAGASYMDRDLILDRIHQIRQTVEYKTSLPSIYLLHGEFSDKEINDLYNHHKVKAMVSFTKGEGFGRPLLEFSLVNKPVITTNWSGHTDFLDKKYTTLIDGEIKPIHKSAVVKNILIEESQWFNLDVNQAHKHLVNMFKNYSDYSKGAKLQYHRSKNSFSYKNMVTTLGNLLDTNIPEFPSTVQLTLPTQGNTPSLNLPKLNIPQNV